MSDSGRSTRRAFLRGESAVRAVRDELAATPLPPNDPPDSATAQTAALLLSVRRRLMACDFEVQFAALPDDHATQSALAALDLIESLEAQLTVYRDTSEVMDINRQAGRAPVEVEEQLFELLELAAELYDSTGGALDITSGPLSRVWGFSQRQGQIPGPDELAAALKRVGFGHVELDRKRRTVRFRRPDLEIHLNCIGKGYALDRAAEVLKDEGLEDFLIQGGRSSVLASGNRPGTHSGWFVGVRHPLRPLQRLGEVCLRDRALATSGSATQSFRHRGRRYGHILDPRTGQPVDGIYSATVLAPSAATADALSTAFYVMRVSEVEAWCAAHPEVAALLVRPSPQAGEIRLVLFGLDESTWIAAE